MAKKFSRWALNWIAELRLNLNVQIEFLFAKFEWETFQVQWLEENQLRPSHPSLHRHRGTFEHKFTNKFFDSLCSRVSRGKRKCFFGDKLCRGRSIHNAETCSKRDFRGNSPSSRSILVNFADEHVGKFVRRVWLRIGNVIAPFWTLGRRGEAGMLEPATSFSRDLIYLAYLQRPARRPLFQWS